MLLETVQDFEVDLGKEKKKDRSFQVTILLAGSAGLATKEQPANIWIF